MRRIAIDDLSPGAIVARSLHFDYGGTMLAAGAALNPGIIAKLRQFGYDSLYIYDEETADVPMYDYIDERERQNISRKLSTLYTSMRQEVQRYLKTHDMPILTGEDLKKESKHGLFRDLGDQMKIRETFVHHVQHILLNILADREICMCVGAIKTVNSYIYDHSIEVAIHSAIMAKRLGFGRTDLVNITLGALLHDIGYIFLPEGLVGKTTKLTAKEVETMKLHASYGYYLLKDREDVSLLAAHVAYQHHEHQDGSGYPRALRGSNKVKNRWGMTAEEPGMIHRYASVVAVPNYYDGLISTLPYQKPMAPDEAIGEICRVSGTVLNAEAVEAFLSYVPIYPLGTTIVVVSGKHSGYIGTVIRIDPDNLSKPVIRLLQDRKRRKIDPIDIDMERSKIQIKAIW